MLFTIPWKQCFGPLVTVSHRASGGVFMPSSTTGHSHRLQFGGKDSFHRSEDSVEFSDWLEDGTESVSLHNSPGYPNKCALVRFWLSDFVSLCLIWTHINFPSLSHLCSLSLSFFFSPSLRMVCSEHHRPRGMCSCLAIINMSYSWADRQNKAQSHFFISFFFFFLQTSPWETIALHRFMGLKFCRNSWKAEIFLASNVTAASSVKCDL